MVIKRVELVPGLLIRQLAVLLSSSNIRLPHLLSQVYGNIKRQAE